jgi:hypothetical protein
MDPRELVLDGNAAAGVLREIFTVEMTVARDTCFACGDVRAPGEVVVCARGPGIVARCPACESVLFRVVRADGRAWIELRGVRSLELRMSG